MSRPRKIEIPGYGSARDAADALGVTVQTVHKHMRVHGDLSRLEKPAPDPIAMPDGSTAAGYTDAAVRLGVSEGCIRHHMHRHGHLRFVGRDRRVRTMVGDGAKWRIRLEEVPGVEVDLADPRPETAPRSGLVVSPPRVAGRRVDVEAVIEIIRQCRDEFLAERDAAA